MSSVFPNGLGDPSSIPGRVIPETQKAVLDATRIKVKWSNPGKEVVPFPTSWCSSYRKGSLWVPLDYNHQLYLLYLLPLFFPLLICFSNSLFSPHSQHLSITNSLPLSLSLSLSLSHRKLSNKPFKTFAFYLFLHINAYIFDILRRAFWSQCHSIYIHNFVISFTFTIDLTFLLYIMLMTITLYSIVVNYVVNSISFQTFFVQPFKIVVDSWKFTMLLLYILWDDWPMFMILGSNQQLQQELEYTLLKPDCHSWWISKMQSGHEE